MEYKSFLVADTFGIEAPKGKTVRGLKDCHALVPDVDPGYVFSKQSLIQVLGWWETGPYKPPLYLTGPSGSGKSTLIQQVAARLNIPLIPFPANPHTELSDLVGQYELVNGNTSFLAGPLTRAVREGYLFLLDEADLLPPGVSAGLNPILSRFPLAIPKCNPIAMHEGFRFVATGNTAGFGDPTGLHAGTLRQNVATMNRYWTVTVSYPEPLYEKLLLEKTFPQLPAEHREKMVQAANEIRQLYLGVSDAAAAIEVTVSTRTLLYWAQAAVTFLNSPYSYSLAISLSNTASSESRAALDGIVQRIFSDATSTLVPVLSGSSSHTQQ